MRPAEENIGPREEVLICNRMGLSRDIFRLVWSGTIHVSDPNIFGVGLYIATIVTRGHEIQHMLNEVIDSNGPT